MSWVQLSIMVSNENIKGCGKVCAVREGYLEWISLKKILSSPRQVRALPLIARVKSICLLQQPTQE